MNKSAGNAKTITSINLPLARTSCGQTKYYFQPITICAKSTITVNNK